MKISVIIPTYNEKKVLERCIESLGAQTLTDFEIIVVDDGSSDGTLQILKNLKRSISSFRFIRQNHLGAGAARNSGAKISKGQILVFVDADMTFDKNFLAKLVDPIEQGRHRGTFSKEEFVANGGSVWAKCWSLNEGWEEGRRHPKGYPDHQKVFRAILKSEFERVGGFTPGGYNDDWSLSEKVGYEAIDAPGAVFYHKNPDSLSEIFRHAMWVGKRKYKFGPLGYLVGLVRSSFPFSLIVGTYYSVRFLLPTFLLFKIVYDFGIFIGILAFIFTHKGYK